VPWKKSHGVHFCAELKKSHSSIDIEIVSRSVCVPGVVSLHWESLVVKHWQHRNNKQIYQET